jgi:hypothetical protein
MCQQGDAYEGIALEKHITASKQRVKVLTVERLQVAAHVQDNISILGAEGLDLAACPKVIVDPVKFARSRIAGIIED